MSLSLDQKQNASDTVVSGIGMLFSLDHKLYASDYDSASDSVASENQPLGSTSTFHLPYSWLNWNLEMLVFEERGKPEYQEKNLSEQGREPTTNSTHKCLVLTPGFEPWATSVGGECSHHNANLVFFLAFTFCKH